MIENAKKSTEKRRGPQKLLLDNNAKDYRKRSQSKGVLKVAGRHDFQRAAHVHDSDAFRVVTFTANLSAIIEATFPMHFISLADARVSAVSALVKYMTYGLNITIPELCSALESTSRLFVDGTRKWSDREYDSSRQPSRTASSGGNLRTWVDTDQELSLENPSSTGRRDLDNTGHMAFPRECAAKPSTTFKKDGDVYAATYEPYLMNGWDLLSGTFGWLVQLRTNADNVIDVKNTVKDGPSEMLRSTGIASGTPGFGGWSRKPWRSAYV
ncbi:hypothetical protein EDB86DRAFT_2828186 [Lactarius hatsudake]|nr:hypothetical protein EDB86DRAFT_2828186 [Lactarius hatsudake]